MTERTAYRLIPAQQGRAGDPILAPHGILKALIGRPDCTIFDVGANIGQSTEVFLSLFEKPIIHAFEPQAAPFAQLHQRFGAIEGVHLNNIALADRVGVAELHCSTHDETASLIPFDSESWWARQLAVQSTGTIPVALDMIDRYCADHDITAIDLLKLDVQGAEPDCLRGAQEMLTARRIRVIQIEIILHRFYARAGGFGDVDALLTPHGYRLFTVFDLLMASDGELLQLDALYALD